MENPNINKLPLRDHYFLTDIEHIPYEVVCARCGKHGMSSEFIIEEGDEWECFPCWKRCNADDEIQKRLKPCWKPFHNEVQLKKHAVENSTHFFIGMTIGFIVGAVVGITFAL